MCVLQSEPGFSLCRAATVITSLKQDSRTMFANIHSHKKPLIHFDITCDPFSGRFIGASSFVYGKQKFAKYSGSASLNVCLRNDVLELFIYLYAIQSSTQGRETALHDVHIDSGGEITTCEWQILKVKDKKSAQQIKNQCMGNSWRGMLLFQINHPVTKALLEGQKDISGKSSGVLNLISCVNKIHRLDTYFWAEFTA